MVAERKEQSRSGSAAEDEDAGGAAAAQPESSVRATVTSGVRLRDEVMVGQGETMPAPSR